MEQGAVTEGYKANLETVVRILNEALATEIVCVLRYKRHYYMAQGLARYELKEQARELALKTAGLLSSSLASDGRISACYDDAGRGLWPPGESFISWNVLALTLLREHGIDSA